jgi:hypothetical protein
LARGAARRIGYWEAVSIGVGGMLGGGIFAVLGLAVELACGGTAIAVAVAGRLARETSSRGWISALAVAACLAARTDRGA